MLGGRPSTATSFRGAVSAAPPPARLPLLAATIDAARAARPARAADGGRNGRAARSRLPPGPRPEASFRSHPHAPQRARRRSRSAGASVRLGAARAFPRSDDVRHYRPSTAVSASAATLGDGFRRQLRSRPAGLRSITATASVTRLVATTSAPRPLNASGRDPPARCFGTRIPAAASSLAADGLVRCAQPGLGRCVTRSRRQVGGGRRLGRGDDRRCDRLSAAPGGAPAGSRAISARRRNPRPSSRAATSSRPSR